MNEEYLIDKTLSGNEAESKAAFEQLTEKYYTRVYDLALRVCEGRAQDAEDAAQQTFVQALENLGSFRKSSRFYTWLYRIAFNCAVGILRKRDIRDGASIDYMVDKYGDSFESSEYAPDEKVAVADDVRLLRVAIEKLPAEYKSPLILREFEGDSYEQIAEKLHIPVGTVRSRLHRARNILRESLERQGVCE